MDNNDFLGSFAQENVSFQTQIIRTSSVGDNFWTVMIFVEPNRYVSASSQVWEDVAGTTTGAKALVVTADDYADYTSGLLKSWLYDLFCNGFTGNCILVSVGSSVSSGPIYSAANPSELGWYILSGTEYVLTQDATIQSGTNYFTDTIGTAVNPSTAGLYVLNGSDYELTTDTTIQSGTNYFTSASAESAFNDAMEESYELLKAYAYHKTVCAGAIDGVVNPQVAVKLASLCKEDKGLLSSAPYYPYTADPTQSTWAVSTDPIYSALQSAGEDAFMSCYADSTRNAALYALGLAMSQTNGSGTCVGNSLDLFGTLLIASSGPSGGELKKALRTILNNNNIQTWKPVGNNSGSVAAEGHKTINGDVIQATWIQSYITYMTKVRVAELMTSRMIFLKTSDNYTRILSIMFNIISLFGSQGSGQLFNVTNTAPSFASLPSSKNTELIIQNAWEATYMPNVDNVKISGTLYIGE